MVRSSEIDDCTMFFCSLMLGRGIVSGTFRLLQKARSFHPASVFFCGTLGMSISWQVVGAFCSLLLWRLDMAFTRLFQR